MDSSLPCNFILGWFYNSCKIAQICGNVDVIDGWSASYGNDVKYISTAAVSGIIVLLILIAVAGYCVWRRGKRNTSNTRVSDTCTKIKIIATFS